MRNNARASSASHVLQPRRRLQPGTYPIARLDPRRISGRHLSPAANIPETALRRYEVKNQVGDTQPGDSINPRNWISNSELYIGTIK